MDFKLVLVIVSILVKPINAKMIQCGIFFKCNTKTHFCDNVAHECVSCIVYCGNYPEYCQQTCPDYYEEQKKGMTTTETILTTELIIDIQNSTLSTDPPGNSDQDQPSMFPLFIPLFVIIVFIIIVIGIFCWKKIQGRNRRGNDTRESQHEDENEPLQNRNPQPQPNPAGSPNGSTVQNEEASYNSTGGERTEENLGHAEIDDSLALPPNSEPPAAAAAATAAATAAAATAAATAAAAEAAAATDPSALTSCTVGGQPVMQATITPEPSTDTERSQLPEDPPSLQPLSGFSLHDENEGIRYRNVAEVMNPHPNDMDLSQEPFSGETVNAGGSNPESMSSMPSSAGALNRHRQNNPVQGNHNQVPRPNPAPNSDHDSDTDESQPYAGHPSIDLTKG